MPILPIQILHLVWALIDEQILDRPARYIEKRAAVARTMSKSSKSTSSSSSTRSLRRTRSATSSTVKVTPSATIASNRSATSSTSNTLPGFSAAAEDQFQLTLGLIIGISIILALIPALYFIKYCYKDKRFSSRFFRSRKGNTSFLAGLKGGDGLATDSVEEIDGAATLNQHLDRPVEQTEQFISGPNHVVGDYASFSSPQILSDSRLLALEHLEYPTADMGSDDDSRLGWEEADQVNFSYQDIIEIAVDPGIDAAANENALAIQEYLQKCNHESHETKAEIVSKVYTQDLDGFQCTVERLNASQYTISIQDEQSSF